MRRLAQGEGPPPQSLLGLDALLKKIQRGQKAAQRVIDLPVSRVLPQEAGERGVGLGILRIARERELRHQKQALQQLAGLFILPDKRGKGRPIRSGEGVKRLFQIAQHARKALHVGGEGRGIKARVEHR